MGLVTILAADVEYPDNDFSGSWNHGGLLLVLNPVYIADYSEYALSVQSRLDSTLGVLADR